MLLLAFLGTGEYKRVHYVFGDERLETAYCPVAAARFLGAESVKVLGTEEAFEKHGESLYAELKSLDAELPHERVTIPSALDEPGAWDLFDVLAEKVPERAAVAIDITHGFRVQPLLALAAAQFLELARGAEVRHIVYGAYEPGKSEVPLVDLQAFLDLHRWIVAVRQFTRDGRAEALAELLKKLQDTSWKPPQPVEDTPDGLRGAKSAGSALRAFTQALTLVRPAEAGEKARDVIHKLEALRPDLERSPALKPIGLLLDEVRTMVEPMQAEDVLTREGLAAQAAMLHVLLRTGQLQQAVTIAREAVVTHEALRRGLDPKPEAKRGHGKTNREQIEDKLGELTQRMRDGQDLGAEAELADLWHRLTSCRNDINHAGMNVRPTPAGTLEGNVRSVVERVACYLEAKTS